MATWDQKLEENGVQRSDKFDAPEPSVKSSLPRVSTARKASDPKSGNEKKAAQAVDILAGFNGTLCMGLAIIGMFGTASEIGDRNDAFREQATAALLTDPKLCDRIISMSGTSGMLGLLAAYSALGFGVLPTARDEVTQLKTRYQERRANAA